MTGFATITVEEATECLIDYRGKTPPKTESGIRLITAKVIKNGRILEDPKEFIATDFYDEWMRRGLPHKLDVLVTTEAPLGEVAILRKAEKVALAQRVILLRAKPDKIEPLFLFYAFQSSFTQGELKSRSSGTTVSGIKQSELRKVRIPVFPLPTQRKIAAILFAYDDLIENNLRRIKILEEMAQTLYREWFVKFRFPGHQKIKMVNSPLGKIPEGWEIRQIGEVIETLGGGTPSTKEPPYWEGGDIDWYSPSDLTASGSMFITGSSKKITQLGLGKSSAKLFPAYSLMMTSRATIGVVSINTQKACTNQGFITCVPNDRLSVFHLYFWIKESREKIISVASGATFKEISRGEFREFPIAVAPPTIENTFAEIVEPMCGLIENLIKKNHNLVVTRDLLLPKLISDELDVSELDITIPEAKA